MNNVCVRPATRADVEGVSKLYEDVIAHLEATHNYPHWMRDTYPTQADAMVLGGSGARVANVPSSAGKLVPQAGVITAVDVAAAAGSALAVSGQIVAVVAAALVAVLSLALTLAAAGVKKGLEKI